MIISNKPTILDVRFILESPNNKHWWSYFKAIRHGKYKKWSLSKKFFLLVYIEIPQNNMPKISKIDCM
jgi:hypothetical protein